jgi:hypothetical protein
MTNEQSSLETLRLALLSEARSSCWCKTRRKPCEVHDAYDDGLCAMVDGLMRVGPISDEQFVSRTHTDEALFGLTWSSHLTVARYLADSGTAE